MIDYQLGKEYEFVVIAPMQRQNRRVRREKRSHSYQVQDSDNQVFHVNSMYRLKVGRVIKCMVNGFKEDTHQPNLVLSLTEQPDNNRPRPIETTRSARIIYTPMGNKR